MVFQPHVTAEQFRFNYSNSDSNYGNCFSSLRGSCLHGFEEKSLLICTARSSAIMRVARWIEYRIAEREPQEFYPVVDRSGTLQVSLPDIQKNRYLYLQANTRIATLMYEPREPGLA